MPMARASKALFKSNKTLSALVGANLHHAFISAQGVVLFKFYFFSASKKASLMK
jgi:hypothetical protein